LVSVAKDCAIALLNLQVLQEKYAATGDESLIVRFKKLVDKKGSVRRATENLITISASLENKSYNKNAKEVSSSLDKFITLIEKSLEHAKLEATTESVMDKLGGEIQTAANEILIEADKFKQAKSAVIQQERGQALITILSIITAGLLIYAAFAYTLGNAISKPIIQVTNMAEKVAAGDLSAKLDIKGKDEVAQLTHIMNDMIDSLAIKAQLATDIANGDLSQDVTLTSGKDTLGLALKSMCANLNELLSQIQEISFNVDGRSKEVSASSMSLSQGATESAASLEEISSSMSELNSQTKTNAENAKEANSQSISASEAANAGTSAMSEMNGAMNEISEASNHIAKIIKVIDDIAFQTNLLALNAAVEAARAGKHGKGFAVVAEEVRALAGRSSKAASETATLIESSLKKVTNGSDISEKTGKALDDIVERIGKVSGLVAEISDSSEEQAIGISQISQGLGQIDKVIQLNTASSEETASASTELAGQAHQLQSNIAKFKLRENALLQKKLNLTPTPTVEKPLVKTTEKPMQTPDNALKEEVWGQPGNQPAENNEDIISLNDDDFGKY